MVAPIAIPRERDLVSREDMLAADPLRSGGPAAQTVKGCGFASDCADAVAALVRNKVTVRIHPLRKCTPGLR
jgi:hypothetical protein